MTNNEVIVNYLKDTIIILKEIALKTRNEELVKPNDQFVMGETISLARVISLFQQQAEAFGIPLEDLNLHDIDPDEDLQGLKRSAHNPFKGKK